LLVGKKKGEYWQNHSGGKKKRNGSASREKKCPPLPVKRKRNGTTREGPRTLKKERRFPPQTSTFLTPNDHEKGRKENPGPFREGRGERGLRREKGNTLVVTHWGPWGRFQRKKRKKKKQVNRQLGRKTAKWFTLRGAKGRRLKKGSNRMKQGGKEKGSFGGKGMASPPPKGRRGGNRQRKGKRGETPALAEGKCSRNLSERKADILRKGGQAPHKGRKTIHPQRGEKRKKEADVSPVRENPRIPLAWFERAAAKGGGGSPTGQGGKSSRSKKKEVRRP